MSQIIDVEALRVYMKLTSWETGASAAADEIIDGLEADLEAFVRRPLVSTEVTDEVVKIDRRGRAQFKNTPVRSISEFKIDGDVVVETAYTVETWGISNVTAFGFSSPLGAQPVVLASYVGGLPGEDPTDGFTRKARATLLRAASRDVNQVVRQDAAGVARLTVEGTSIEFHGGVKAGAGGLTQDEKDQFLRWKRRITR